MQHMLTMLSMNCLRSRNLQEATNHPYSNARQLCAAQHNPGSTCATLDAYQSQSSAEEREQLVQHEGTLQMRIFQHCDSQCCLLRKREVLDDDRVENVPPVLPFCPPGTSPSPPPPPGRPGKRLRPKPTRIPRKIPGEKCVNSPYGSSAGR